MVLVCLSMGFHNLSSFKLIGIVDRVCGYVRFEYFMGCWLVYIQWIIRE